MAGNEEHPFASIVAAYHESQTPAPDADGVPAAEPEAVEESTAEESAQISDADQALPEEPSEPAGMSEPEAAEPAAIVEPAEPAAPESAEPTPEWEPEPTPGPEPTPAPDAVAEVPDSEKPSALVDPFKSILAAYYAQSIDEPPAPKPIEEPAPASATEVAEAPRNAEPTPVEPAAAELAEETIAPTPAAPVDEPEPAALHAEAAEPEPTPEVEPVAADAQPEDLPGAAVLPEAAVPEPAPEPEPTQTGLWARHAAPAEATGAAASVLAAYYAGADEPATTEQAAPEPTDLDQPVADELVAETEPAADPDATAVLPAAVGGLPDSPSNPLGTRPVTGNWGAEALAAAGSTPLTEPVMDAQRPVEEAPRPAVVRPKIVDTTETQPEKQRTSHARRTFLLLAPVGAIAALAVLAILLLNQHSSTPSGAPASPSSTPTLILDGSPLKRTQEAYASVLNRFNNANDAGSAVVAGGAAHDTLKLMKDFKGATAQDKALLAAERAHLSSLSDLAGASPSGYAGSVGQAKTTLAAVQKAADADPQAKAPNSIPGTSAAIDLLGEGNVAKLQATLTSLVARCDGATLTSQLRSVAADAAGDSDAANSLASVIKNPSVQTTASTLANKFSSLAPMARLTGDTLSDWSTMRPGMLSAMGVDPTSHIDTLIANAQQKMAVWQANQGNNATVAAINSYANSMRSHFGAFGGALGQIPSLSAGTGCNPTSSQSSQAGNAAAAVNSAAFGGNPPAALVSAHNALIDAINTGTRAATAAQNVTQACTGGTYGQQSDWGTYTGNIWIKGGWGGKVAAWESAVSAALQQASAAGPKPIV